jgi:signal transduction histidine kinase
MKICFAFGKLWFAFAVGFFCTLVIASETLAQPALPTDLPSGASSVVTNLLQLSKIFKNSSRINADVRLDVIVCSSSRPEVGVVAVKDETGAEILQLGPREVAFAAGDNIHIEGRSCLLRRTELGIEITRSPAVDNDGTHGLLGVEAEVNLSKGLHPFQLDYFNFLGAYGLELSCQSPAGSVEDITPYLYTPNGAFALETNMVPGLTATYYEGGWLSLPDFSLLQPIITLSVTNLNPIIGPSKELFGICFKGLFLAPTSGVYKFNLQSDDGSQLFLDDSEIPITTTGHEEVPSPIVSSLREPMNDSETSKWMSVEGRVSFASRSGRGLRFELRLQSDSIWVFVADCKDMDPMRLLNSRIRVSGIGRAVLVTSRDPVLGEFSVATADNISILEESMGTLSSSGLTPMAVSIGQIQSLSSEEAARHLPVRIQGVVTSIAPSVSRFMSIQDETRGIFVSLSSSVESSAVVGQFCEVVGYTDVGDFAPIVVAQKINILGDGQMPPPARPTWKELINGSMDVQWVEIQGLVTAVQGNTFDLLLPQGELHIKAEANSESQLRSVQQAVIRLRGVLFAEWNTNRTVQVGHVSMQNMIINVDAQAPRDPFDASLKSWNKLYQFDSRATTFQRVKVRGNVIYADSGQVFIMNNARGIRVSLVESTNVQFGEEVEVVGYLDISGPAPLLREAMLRKTGRKVDLKPRILDGSELMQENVDSTLVRISAKLMGIHSQQDSVVLEMNTGGHLFLAPLPAGEGSPSLRVGSQLQLTGVYVGEGTTWSAGNKPSGFELLLNSPSQLTVLWQPSWWTPRRLLIMVGLLIIILTLAAVWISQLQRLVEQRTLQLKQEIRVREAAERERALETERSRIARDLHDDLGSSLTEIGVLASKGDRLSALEELTSLFNGISAKARELVTSLDTIVWAVDPEHNSIESVADYLSDFASEYLSHSRIACRFDVPVALPAIALDGRSRHNLLLAVKETLNNIVRHSHATEVKFRMTCAEDLLQIIISENGIGFDPKLNYCGNGLKNLPLRLSKLGGRYSIESSIGKGTIVTIGLRLSPRTDKVSVGGES